MTLCHKIQHHNKVFVSKEAVSESCCLPHFDTDRHSNDHVCCVIKWCLLTRSAVVFLKTCHCSLLLLLEIRHCSLLLFQISTTFSELIMIQQYFRCSFADTFEQCFLLSSQCVFMSRTPVVSETNRHTVNYSSLPGELRNQIMEELLAPGDVWVSRPPRPGITLEGHHVLAALILFLSGVCFLFTVGLAYLFPGNVTIYLSRLAYLGLGSGFVYTFLVIYWYTTRRKLFNYRFQYSPSRWKAERTNGPNFDGRQFLVASKQTCKEGSSIFFPENAFHLPPGSLLETWIWLTGLGEDQRQAIGPFVCDFSLLDLDPLDVHIAYLCACFRKKFLSRGFNFMDIWRYMMLDSLELKWCDKVDFILKRESKSDRQSLRCKIMSMFKRQETTEERLLRAKYTDEMQKASKALDRVISQKIRDLGPQASKRWLIHQEDWEGIEHVHTTKGMLKRTHNSWRYEQ